MSVAEIQDNKWEVEASKPPLKNVSSIGVIIMMSGFILFFVWVIVFSVIGSFTDVKEMDFDKKQKAAAAAEPAE